MPFENSIVVAQLKGKYVYNIIDYLIASKQANPTSKLKILIDKDYNVIHSLINNKAIDSSKVYYVATNDYLFYGGDNMDFLSTPTVYMF